MPDIIQASALKVQIQSPGIINKAHEIYNLIVNLVPQIPQEGQRCIPLVALDISCALNLYIEFPRQHFAKAAVVPQSVYQRYFEAFLDVLESHKLSLISFEYVLRSLLLYKYAAVADKFFKNLPHSGTNICGLEKRSNFAIAAYLTSACINRPIDIEILCTIAGCVGNKTFSAQLKSAKAKFKDLIKELKKEASEVPLNQVQIQEPELLKPSTVHCHMHDGSGEGVLSFSGINELKLLHL